MTYLGDFRLGETFDAKFCTVQSTGAPTTLAGSPVVSAYPGNSTTQITAGITLSVDFDSVTGMHNVRVVATSGNGYATATNYALVITTGTVNSVSAVGYVVGHFSIENRSALMPTTAARTLDVSATGEAGVDLANVGSPTTTLNLSGTTIKTATDVETDTADIQTRIGTAGAGLTALGDTRIANLDAAVSTRSTYAGGAVASVTGNVGGNVTGSIGSLATQAKADVNAEVDTAISDAALATAANLTTVDTVVDAIKVKTDSLTFTVANRVDSQVAGMNTGVVDAAATATDMHEESADVLLGRNVAGGSNTGRLVKWAFYRLVNRFRNAAGTATYYATDDSTAVFTQTLTTAAGDPVSEADTD